MNTSLLRLLPFALLAALTLGIARAADLAVPVQDLRLLLPAELRLGPATLQGRIIHRATDGSWMRFKLRSDRGEIAYRVTGFTPVDLTVPLQAAPADSVAVRGIPLDELRPTAAGSPDLWWEGEITAIASAGAELEATVIFGGVAHRVAMALSEHVPKGLDPAPTYRNVHYGPDERQVLDVWIAPGPGRKPVAVYLHGGGWTKGDKADLRGQHVLLAAGISVISINYRYCPPENPAGDVPAVAWPMQDAARAIQFVRSQADVWNLDAARVGAWGASAGACSALWVAMHPDLADPHASDHVARESSRPNVVAGIFPQTSLDPAEMRAWVGPRLSYGPHAFAIKAESGIPLFDTFLSARERLQPWIASYSPAAQLTADDGPIFLDYLDFTLNASEPFDAYYTHSPGFGLGFLERARAVGVDCHVRFSGREDPRYTGWSDFLITSLTSPQPGLASTPRAR